jgi:hypothetical protein
VPEKYRRYLWWPTDRDLEVIITDRDRDEVREEVDAIVEKFGGTFASWPSAGKAITTKRVPPNPMTATGTSSGR